MCELEALTFEYNENRPLAASLVLITKFEGMQATGTNQIEIVVNGQTRLVTEGQTLSELLVFLKVDPARIAVELNRSIVPRKAWDSTLINGLATLEIVQFVGGG